HSQGFRAERGRERERERRRTTGTWGGLTPHARTLSRGRDTQTSCLSTCLRFGCLFSTRRTSTDLSRLTWCAHAVTGATCAALFPEEDQKKNNPLNARP